MPFILLMMDVGLNPYPAFLHGEQALVALLLGGVIALLGVPLLYVWLWHTKVAEWKLAVAYFMIATASCAELAFGRHDPFSILSLTIFALGFISSLPWSLLMGWVLSAGLDAELTDGKLAIVVLLAAGVNAVLLYLAAAKIRRLIR